MSSPLPVAISTECRCGRESPMISRPARASSSHSTRLPWILITGSSRRTRDTDLLVALTRAEPSGPFSLSFRQTRTNKSSKMQAIGKYRWVIVTLLFFATTINYLDRQVIGLLKDALARDLHWTETDYGRIVTAFSAAYAIGLLLLGRLTDKIGTKAGYSVAIT